MTTIDYKNIGKLKLDEEKYLDAIEYLSKAIVLNKRDFELYLYIGIAYFEIKDWDNAELNLKSAFRLDRTSLDCLKWLCKLYFEKSNLARTHFYLKKCIEITKDDVLVLGLMGRYFYYKNKPKEANEYFKRTEQIIKKHPAGKPYKLYAEIYKYYGDFKNDYNIIPDLVGKGYETIKQEKSIDGKRLFQKSIESYPDYFEGHIALIETLIQEVENRGKPQKFYIKIKNNKEGSGLPLDFYKIWNSLKKVESLKPNDPYVFGLYAKAYKVIGKIENEKTYLEKQSKILDKKETKINILPMKENILKVAILTALNEEYDAVKSHLLQPVIIKEKGIMYVRGKFIYKGNEIAEVTIKVTGPKNVNASKVTSDMIHSFGDKYFDAIFYTGIAGSRKDFKVGDVICAESVLAYDGKKSLETRDNFRPESKPFTEDLKQFTQEARITLEWKEFLTKDIESIISNVKSKSKIKNGKEIENTEYDFLSKENLAVDTGIIASGDSVVEHADGTAGTTLTQAYDNAQVVEMEGFGFAKSALELTSQTRIEYVGLIRGISDKIKKEKKTEEVENTNPNNRPDEVKHLASATAAAFTYYLIYKISQESDEGKRKQLSENTLKKEIDRIVYKK